MRTNKKIRFQNTGTLIANAQAAIKEFQAGNSEPLRTLMRECPTRMRDILEKELTESEIIGFNFEGWNSARKGHLEEIDDFDFSDLHPDETVEEFWSHEG